MGHPLWHNSAMLEILGLDAQVGKVYEILLRGRPFTVRDLATASGLTPPRVRSALRRLAQHGLVTQLSGSPPRHLAVDPSLALDRLLLQREEQLRQARVHSQEVGERFREAAAGRDPAKLVEFVTGREQIIQRYDQLQRSARRELRAFERPPYQPGCDSDAELDLLDQGVQVRVLFESTAADHSARFVAAGGEARVLPTLPVKLLIVDDRLAVVPLQDATDTPSSSNVIVHQSALLNALSGLFESLWRHALPLDPAGSEVENGMPGPDPSERRILGLMNAGLPDEAIARHLGLSHRTLQRRIRDLMERLHAATRYQLGAQAAARGWCAPPGDPSDDEPIRVVG
jgi:sugar-specific transcriptional regulator TrmB/DNA-binding CsgD family transcriptional regulator